MFFPPNDKTKNKSAGCSASWDLANTKSPTDTVTTWVGILDPGQTWANCGDQPLDWADHINTFRREQHYRPSPIITNFSRAQKYHDNLLRLICPGKISYLVSAVSWRISSLSSRDIVRASTSWPEETSPPPSCCPDLRGAHSLKNGLMITVMMMIMLTCGWRSVVWVHLMWYELL